MGDKRARYDALNEEMTGATFWNDPERAKQVIQEMKALKGVLEPFEDLCRQADDLEAMIEMSEEVGDDSFDEEIREATRRAAADFEAFELRSMLGGP